LQEGILGLRCNMVAHEACRSRGQPLWGTSHMVTSYKSVHCIAAEMLGLLWGIFHLVYSYSSVHRGAAKMLGLLWGSFHLVSSYWSVHCGAAKMLGWLYWMTVVQLCHWSIRALVLFWPQQRNHPPPHTLAPPRQAGFPGKAHLCNHVSRRPPLQHKKT
jgi:hypothetical protein